METGDDDPVALLKYDPAAVAIRASQRGDDALQKLSEFAVQLLRYTSMLDNTSNSNVTSIGDATATDESSGETKAEVIPEEKETFDNEETLDEKKAEVVEEEVVAMEAEEFCSASTGGEAKCEKNAEVDQKGDGMDESFSAVQVKAEVGHEAIEVSGPEEVHSASTDEEVSHEKKLVFDKDENKGVPGEEVRNASPQVEVQAQKKAEIKDERKIMEIEEVHSVSTDEEDPIRDKVDGEKEEIKIGKKEKVDVDREDKAVTKVKGADTGVITEREIEVKSMEKEEKETVADKDEGEEIIESEPNDILQAPSRRKRTAQGAAPLTSPKTTTPQQDEAMKPSPFHNCILTVSPAYGSVLTARYHALGDLVYTKDYNGGLHEAVVKDAIYINGHWHYLMHYKGWNALRDKWFRQECLLSRYSEEIQRLPAPLSVGDPVFTKDDFGRLHDATIIDTTLVNSCWGYLVRYKGWRSSCDKWINQNYVVRQVSSPAPRLLVGQTGRQQTVGRVVTQTAMSSRKRPSEPHTTITAGEGGCRPIKLARGEDFQSSRLQKSVGRTRHILNQYFTKLGLTAKFSEGVISSRGGRVSHLTLSSEWNDFPQHKGQTLEWWLGEGPTRLALASPLDPSNQPQPKEGVPVFWANKQGGGGALCHYVGHFLCIRFEKRQLVLKGRPRQALIEFIFVKFDQKLANEIELLPP